MYVKLLDWVDINKIDWDMMSINPRGLELINNNIKNKNINLNYMSSNTDVSVIEILNDYKNIINWDLLSINKNAINMLEKNQDKINWKYLSLNENAITLLKNNFDKIDWVNLSQNPNSIKLTT